MAGPLTGDAGYPAGPLGAGGSGGRTAKDILDEATRRLLDGAATYPYRAAAAAIFSQGRPGSLAGALGAGMQAQLETEIGAKKLPFEALRQRAATELDMAQARQAELQNRINELNLGYFTDLGGAGPPGGGRGAQPEPAAAAGQLPLTEQSAQQLSQLQVRLQRALEWSRRAPAAYDDVFKIQDEMTQIVQDDPLAKQHIEQVNKQHEADVKFESDVRQAIAAVPKDAMAQANETLKSLAASPNATQIALIPKDPKLVDQWLQNRAKSYMQERYAELRRTLEAQGKDPNDYLPPGVGTASAAAPAEPPGGATPAAGATPAGDAGALQPEPEIFTERPLSPEEEIKVKTEQEEAAQNITTAETANADLDRALELNEKALQGSDWMTGIQKEGRRAVSAVTGYDDPTLAATAELESILSGQTLQNLQQLKGNPTEGERQFIQQLGGKTGMSAAERRALLQRGKRLLAPRLMYERIRSRYAAAGKPMPSRTYAEWLTEAFGKDGELIYRGDEKAIDRALGGQ